MRLWFIPAILTVFCLLSVLTLSSIAPALASRQLIFFVLGGIVFWLATQQHFSRLEQLGIAGYISLCLLLILTLVRGSATKGSTRWIDVGDLFSIQPSQLAIPLVSIFILKVFSQRSLRKAQNVLLFLTVLAIPAALIFIAPDLGTTLVFLGSVALILFLRETQLWHLGLLAVIGCVVGILAWNFLLEPYQKARVTSFIGVTADPKDSGYNARQSLIAAGSGKLTGQGLGQGTQSHLRFLPERQTDFVFASFAEEFGFIGSIMVVGLYCALIITTYQIALGAKSRNEQLFCLVTAWMTAVQATINIGMNIGIFPITGVTLPLLSYGGSSVVTLMGMYGIVQAVRLQQLQKVTLHLH